MTLARRLTFLIAVAALVLLLVEALVRIFAWGTLEFRLAEKRLHCLEANGDIGLCPDQRIRFRHPLGFEYTVSTNQLGERVTNIDDRDAPSQEVWIIGDSIAMGYGLDDERTAAAILARESGLAVRNLGVDALGAGAIARRLKARLSGAQSPPALVAWPFHASDFQDDQDDASASAARRMLRQAIFLISRHSALANALRLMGEELGLWGTPNRYVEPNAPATPPVEPPPDHPTYAHIAEIGTMLRERGVRFAFLLYPEIDRTTGLASGSTPLKNRAASVASESGALIIDLRARFAAYSDSDLYLARDGHPSVAANRFFAEALQQLLRNARQ